KVSMTFLIEAPDHIRLEAESPMGGSLASLASDGKRFQLLDVRQNRFLEGEALPCNIARLIRVELSPAEAVAIMSGGAPLPPGLSPEDAQVEWDPANGGREMLRLRRPGG